MPLHLKNQTKKLMQFTSATRLSVCNAVRIRGFASPDFSGFAIIGVTFVYMTYYNDL
jgi:hypothetical protein